MDPAESELHVEANENADNEEHSNEEESSNGSCPFDFEASRSRSPMSDPSVEAPKPKRPKATMKKQEQKEAQIINRLSEAISERAKRKSAGGQNKNAASLFGKFVAESLAELDPITRNQAQFQISNIIYSAQMGQLQQEQIFQSYATPRWIPPMMPMGASRNPQRSLIPPEQQHQQSFPGHLNNSGMSQGELQHKGETVETAKSFTRMLEQE